MIKVSQDHAPEGPERCRIKHVAGVPEPDATLAGSAPIERWIGYPAIGPGERLAMSGLTYRLARTKDATPRRTKCRQR
jgi:hypothetical protein